jgi:glycosyltransferase involved in cell wall biosynthesis
MNLAIILPSLANKGPTLVARDIVGYLVECHENVKVDVYYFDLGPSIEFKCPTFRISFFQSIDFGKYDLIHSHMLRPDAYLFFHRKKINIPIISTLHVYMGLDLKFTYNKLVAFVFERIWSKILASFDKTVVLSTDMQNYYLKRTSKLNFTIVNNGRNVEDFKINPEIVTRVETQFNGKIVLGVIAYLTKRKGIEQLINVLKLNSDLALLIVGDGPEYKRLAQLSKEQFVSDRVIFLGYQNNAHIFNKIIDIYVLPSRSEGLPMSLIEAAYYSKPSICSNLELFREFFTEDEIVIFNLDDSKSLLNAVQIALEKKQVLATNILKRYDCSYKVEMMGSNYYKLYKNLISGYHA